MNWTLDQFSKGHFSRRDLQCTVMCWLCDFVHNRWHFHVLKRWVLPPGLPNGCHVATSHIWMESVIVTFSPPDYGWEGPAVRHQSEQVVPVPCGGCQCAWDEGLHGTQQALPLLKRWVLVPYSWCSPSTRSHVECNLIYLFLWQKVFNRWVFWPCYQPSALEMVWDLFEVNTGIKC